MKVHDYGRSYILDRITEDPSTGCWTWLLSTGSHGYGQCYDGTTVCLAHRRAWALWRGRLPTGRGREAMTLDHVCRNRVCCNPWHLRLLPNHINAADNRQAQRKNPTWRKF